MTPEHTDPEYDSDNVVPLRRTAPAALPAAPRDQIERDDTVTGELLTEEESAAVDRRMAAQRAAVSTRQAAGAVVRVVRTGVTHERTRSAGRAVVRNAGYTVAGARARRAERRTRRKHLDLEQAITTLRVNAKGPEDYTVLRDLEAALEARRTGAAQRGKERRIEILRWSGGVIVVLASGHVVLLGIAAVQAVIGAGSLTDRWHGMVEFWSTVIEASPVGGYWWAWALAGAGTWAVRSNLAGRALGTLPVWAAPLETTPADGRNVVPDEGAVLAALRNLGGLPLLREAFKKGWGTTITPTWVDVPHRDGKGWRMRLVLPAGVPVEEIVRRKTVFAHNLVRLPVEVWPSEPKDKPGVLDLWVADQGALSGPVEPWPLLHKGTTDFFKGVPGGYNIRGELVTARLFEVNYAVAGMMGSGKSTFVISLVAGAILDPLVDVDVFVLAENADYDPFERRLRTLKTGASPDTVKACLDNLKALYMSLEERGQLLKANGERSLTRKLAETYPQMRPRVVVVDECQALFMDADLGEEAANVAVLLQNAARKYGIVLVWATPEGSTAALPRKLMAVTAIKLCFAIGDQQSNDAVLGTGSYKAGISAVSLEPKTAEGPGDIGTAMTRGLMARPGLVRSCYLRKSEDVDEVTPVVERALALREGAGIADAPADPEPVEVDTLADIARVLVPAKRMRTAEVLQRLATLNPGHYTGWSLETLTAYLTPLGAAPYKTGGVMQIGADRITDAITERDSSGDGEQDGE